MKKSAVKRRDCIGPRRPSPSYSDPPILYPEGEVHLIDRLIKIQNRNFENHKELSVSCPRRATISDVNKMFKWSFNNAIEWASQFDPFQKLTNEAQKCVLSEYGVAFLVIDQGFRTVKSNGCWIMQNGTYLHSDYHYGQAEDVMEADYKCLRNHFEFVTALQIGIQKPFEAMDIDKFEIAALKSLLLVTPSFPKRNIFSDYQERMTALKNKCFTELMDYLSIHYPETHVERFGSLMLILGEIRTAVKMIYNHSKVSDLFDFRKFDPYVRSFLSA
uniref:NR LBD domain-containing protein n=1 Tax=Caenorhabditis tropicalis TaxID=1561998 RepID=A0A1I7U2F4_9PELO